MRTTITSLFTLLACAAVWAHPQDRGLPTVERPTAVHLELGAGTQGAATALLDLDGVETALLLEPHSVRSPGFRLLLCGADGRLTEVAAPPVPTYRGIALRSGTSSAEGQVVATLRDGALDASIVFPGGEQWQLRSDRNQNGIAAGQVRHTLARGGGAGTRPAASAATPPPPSPPPMGGLSAGNRVVDIAFDSDYEFYQLNNSSVGDTLADIELVMNGVSALYEAYTGVAFEVTTVVVRTAEPDPYTFTIAGGLLAQFRSHWNSQFGMVRRDLAHLMTGKDLDGATVGDGMFSVVCSQTSGYAISQSRFSSTLAERVAVTAQFIGRNFGATTCDGQQDCSTMCSTIGGCAGVGSFGVDAISKIAPAAANSSCLTTQPTTLTLPFLDNFTAAPVDPSLWTYVDGATVSGSAVSPPSGSLALRLAADGAGAHDDHEVRTNVVDLSQAASATLRFHSQHRGVENGEELVVEYTTGLLAWQEVGRVTSNGVDQSSFVFHEINLPGAALSSEFRLRFRTEVNASDDAWFLDDVELLELDFDPPQLSGLTLNPDPWDLAGPLDVSVTAVDTQSGVQSIDVDLKDGPTTVAQISLSPAGGDLYSGQFGTGLPLLEKTYTVEINALDNQDNGSQLGGPIDTFDLPVISDLTVTPTLPLDSETLSVSCLVTDPTSSIQSVSAEYLLNGGSFTQVSLSYNGGSGRYEGSFSATGSPGTLNVTARATDSADNDAVPVALAMQVYVTGGVGPTLSGLIAAPDPLEVGQPLGMQVTVTDADSPLQSVTARLIQSSSEVTSIVLNNTSGNLYGGAFLSTGGLVDGTFTLEVTATDIQDNEQTTSTTLDAYTAPTITNLSVSPSSFDATQSYTISAQVTHPSGIDWVLGGVSLDGAPFTEQPLTFNGGSGRYEGTFSPTGQAGTLTYRFRAASNNSHEATPVSSTVAVDPAPVTVTAVSPSSGSLGGGTLITLTGTGLKVDVDQGSARVLVDGVDATNVALISDTEMRARTPAGAGTGTVHVQVRVDKQATLFTDSLPNSFEYGVAPTISAVTPASGPAFQECTVVIRGVGFAGDGDPGNTQVRVGSRDATSFTVVDDQTLIAVLPPSQQVGAVEPVSVSHPFGSISMAQAFQSLGTSMRQAQASALPPGGSPRSMAVLSDMNDDGHPELAVGVPDAGTGKLLLRSGVDLGSLSILSSPTAAGGGYGAALVAVPDLSGDGLRDLVVGEPSANVGALTDAGMVHAINPINGQVIWSASGPAAQAALGGAVVDLGDLNGDGHNEVAAGLPGNGAGAVWILDGQSGSQLDSLAGVDGGERFGDGLCSVVPLAPGADRLLAVAAPEAAPGGLFRAGRATFYRITPTTLTVSAPLTVSGTEIGGCDGPFGVELGLALLKDASGNDLLALGFPGSDAAGVDSGRVRARVPGAGSDLWSLDGLLPGSGLGGSLAAASDYDDDGALDLVAGAAGEGDPGTSERGALHFISGADGTPLSSIWGTVPGLRLGGRVFACHDPGVDLLPDLFGLTDAGGSGDGVVRYTLDSASFTRVARAGDKLSGAASGRNDLDGLRYEMVDGEKLVFTVKDKKKYKDPLVVALHDENGTPLLSSDPASPYFGGPLTKRKGKKLTVTFSADRNLTLHLAIGRAGKPANQKYSLTCKRKSSGKVPLVQTTPFSAGSPPLTVQFHAPAGARLGGSVTVVPGSLGLTAEQLLDPDGNDLLTPAAVKTAKKGNKITLKSARLGLPETGTYDFAVQPGVGGSGELRFKLSVLLPAGKAKLTDGD